MGRTGRAWSPPTTRRSRGSTAAPARRADFDAAVERWRGLRTEDGASFDREVTVDASALSPMVSWGTNPGQVVGVTDGGARARAPTARSAP